jgi:hypothetical protein
MATTEANLLADLTAIGSPSTDPIDTEANFSDAHARTDELDRFIMTFGSGRKLEGGGYN